MKTYTLSQIEDIYIGPKGSEDREAYERELERELKSRKMHRIASRRYAVQPTANMMREINLATTDSHLTTQP